MVSDKHFCFPCSQYCQLGPSVYYGKVFGSRKGQVGYQAVFLFDDASGFGIISNYDSCIACFLTQIANALFDGSMQIMYIVIVMAFFACLDLMLLSYFRTFQQITIYSTFLVLQTYIGVVVSIVLTWMHQPIDVVVLGRLSGFFLVFVAMAILIVRELGFTTKLKSLKEELKFAIPTVPNNVSSWIVDSSDRIVIGVVLGSVAVGCYSPGYSLGNLILMFLTPFAVLLPAVLPEYYEKGDMEKVDTFLTYSLKYYLLITIPACVGLSILSKPLLYVLTTTIIADSGYLVTPLVALGAMFMGIYVLSTILSFWKRKQQFSLTFGLQLQF